MITQIAILLTGVIAIYLTQQSNEHLKKYACIFGLIGQPFWMYATYTSGQLGIFLLTFAYTYAWGQGFYQYWIKSYKENKKNNDQKIVFYNDLEKLRKISGISTGGGLISNDFFMKKYNEMNITKKELEEIEYNTYKKISWLDRWKFRFNANHKISLVDRWKYRYILRTNKSARKTYIMIQYAINKLEKIKPDLKEGYLRVADIMLQQFNHLKSKAFVYETAQLRYNTSTALIRLNQFLQDVTNYKEDTESKQEYVHVRKSRIDRYSEEEQKKIKKYLEELIDKNNIRIESVPLTFWSDEEDKLEKEEKKYFEYYNIDKPDTFLVDPEDRYKFIMNYKILCLLLKKIIQGKESLADIDINNWSKNDRLKTRKKCLEELDDIELMLDLNDSSEQINSCVKPRLFDIEEKILNLGCEVHKSLKEY